MELIITQSASVARILATFFNANNRHFNYYSSQTHLVVWIDDCKVDLKPLSFTPDNDSFVPKDFLGYKLKLVKRTNKNTPCLAQSKKVQLIKRLILKSKSIVIASEPSQTQRRKFEYFKEFFNITQPCKTLWLYSLEKSFLKNHLYLDNTTSCFKTYYNRDLIFKIVQNRLSGYYYNQTGTKIKLGLIKTALIALLSKKHLKSEASKTKTRYRVSVELSFKGKLFCCFFEKKYKKLKQAEDLAGLLSKDSRVEVSEKKIQTLRQKQLLLYDFISLIISLNKLYGFSFSKSKQALLSLYRQRFISYPLTLNNYLPSWYKSSIPRLLNALRDYPLFKQELLTLKLARLNYKDVIIDNDLKTHGIIPTLKIPTCLNTCEKVIYQMIVRRTIDCFTPKEDIKKVSFNLFIDDEDLDLPLEIYRKELLKGSKINTLETLELINNIQTFKVESVSVVTQTRKQYPLFSIEHLFKKLKKDFIKTLHENGIEQMQYCFFTDLFLGLSLTLDQLIKQEYLYIDNKKLFCTNKALDYYFKTKDLPVSSFVYLFDFEVLFFKTNQAEINKEMFYKISCEKLKELNQSISFLKESKEPLKGSCPMCLNKGFKLNYQRLACLNKTCNWTIPRLAFGVHLSKDELEELLGLKKINKVFVLTTRKNICFKAYLFLDKNARLMFDSVE
ncbi:DNA topoisomerase [Myroides odoratimimus]|uniref:DNA topoisomerase n=1 Tax=Myroides odoratimimus TaxID=76832 RepID=UPI00217FFF07|nr:DNA topoisomerase [Myroides odoratimimus]MCS7474896.1 DNA topoisomerase [Myroides odoratimimus]